MAKPLAKPERGLLHNRRPQYDYDWDNWLDGQAWELVNGVDYGSLSTLRSAASQKAFRNGVRVKVTKVEETTGPERVIIQRLEET